MMSQYFEVTAIAAKYFYIFVAIVAVIAGVVIFDSRLNSLRRNKNPMQVNPDASQQGAPLIPELAADELTVALTWQPRTSVGEHFDLDVSAVTLDGQDKSIDRPGFVFYNNSSFAGGAIELATGSAEGERKIIIRPSRLPSEAEKVIFAATIYQGDEQKQNFGQVARAQLGLFTKQDPIATYDLSKVVLVDDQDQNLTHINGSKLRVFNSPAPIVSFDLSEDFASDNCFLFGELRRASGKWQFFNIGQGFSGGLRALHEKYQIPLDDHFFD